MLYKLREKRPIIRTISQPKWIMMRTQLRSMLNKRSFQAWLIRQLVNGISDIVERYKYTLVLILYKDYLNYLLLAVKFFLVYNLFRAISNQG
jgi:hypothetical protein